MKGLIPANDNFLHGADMLRYLVDPIFQVLNTAGKPATGGYIEVYVHGTGDKYYCASNFDGTLHPFKIPLNSLGTNTILADDANSYDIYVYNRYGSLLISRENVSPVGGVADIEESLAQKKDKQQAVNFNGSAGKTVKKITQDENGVVNVEFEDIDTPAEAPNVEITSPNGTIDVHSSTNPQTNTKTFTLDVKGAPDYYIGECNWKTFTVSRDIVPDLTRTSGSLNLSNPGVGKFLVCVNVRFKSAAAPENRLGELWISLGPEGTFTQMKLVDYSQNQQEDCMTVVAIKEISLSGEPLIITLSPDNAPQAGLDVIISNVSVYRISAAAGSVSGLESVSTDASLTGDGTSEDPLSVVVDDTLDADSENPVQNKVLYAVIGDVETLLEDL